MQGHTGEFIAEHLGSGFFPAETRRGKCSLREGRNWKVWKKMFQAVRAAGPRPHIAQHRDTPEHVQTQNEPTSGGYSSFLEPLHLHDNRKSPAWEFALCFLRIHLIPAKSFSLLCNEILSLHPARHLETQVISIKQPQLITVLPHTQKVILNAAKGQVVIIFTKSESFLSSNSLNIYTHYTHWTIVQPFWKSSLERD